MSVSLGVLVADQSVPRIPLSLPTTLTSEGEKRNATRGYEGSLCHHRSVVDGVLRDPRF